MVSTVEMLRTVVPTRVSLMIHVFPVLYPPPRTRRFAGTIPRARGASFCHISCSAPSTTNQKFRRHYHKCDGGTSIFYQSFDPATEVHMASSFQADQTPIHDLTSSTAHTMSTSSAPTLLFQSIGLTNRCTERLVTSSSADNMGIWHAYDDYTTYWTSKSPSDLIHRTHTADLIILPVCATASVLHSNHTFSSVTCSTQIPSTTCSGRQRPELIKIHPPRYIPYESHYVTIIYLQHYHVPS